MWRWIPVLLVFGCVSEVRSESPVRKPTSLDECYLEIVKTKSDADAAYVARELCDAVFAHKRRSLFLHVKGGPCVEWWLDKRGRYETHDLMCAFEPAGGPKWTLACQYKDKASRVTLVELREEGDRYRRTGDATGVDPGEIFKTMAACIRHKAVR
jgi:hypothetical protein